MDKKQDEWRREIKNNPCVSKSDIEKLFLDLLSPLEPFYAERPGRLKLGTHGTVYTEKRRQIEAYLRPLWGLGPYLTEKDHVLLGSYLDGIKKGTDPTSTDYWGRISDSDQLVVEMASLSTALLLNKEKLWDSLNEQEQKHLHQWLLQANDRQLPRNNWHFFRVLVNLAMKNCGMDYSQQIMESDLETIESFYQENGWYFDGKETQVDYYVSFAIHYYSLIYCRYMEKEDPVRVEKMKRRACLFAQSFKYWFDAKGRGLPFGRSLTYRFAQIAFFSALVFADVEALPWGEIKGLISRHLRHWISQEITTTDGLLSVGYHYQNLVFAEGYNGPGSPYWSFKSFLLLAVPESHPYWQAEAVGLNIEKRHRSVPESRNYYQYNQNLQHLLAFPAGQYVDNQNHASAKYSKFVYSTQFGFSVPKSNDSYKEGAYDNCLALSEDGQGYRTKRLDKQFQLLEDRIIHWWQPWGNVWIKSTILPFEQCHVRLHEVRNDRLLYAYEGGFSVPVGAMEEKIKQCLASVTTSIGRTIVEGVRGYTEAGIIRTEPNTSLYFPSAVLPYTSAVLEPGSHLLVAVISGLLPGEKIDNPVINGTGKEITIVQHQQRKKVILEG